MDGESSAPSIAATDTAQTRHKTWTDFFRSLAAFSGPGYLIASGYVDPGNVASSLASGSRWSYAQLNVTLVSSCLAMYFQYLAIKLGIVTQKDLAESCRANMHWALNLVFYFFAEVAIVATDIANLLGAAIAMNLLFGLRMDIAVALTSLDVMLLLVGWNANFARKFELATIVLVLLIGVCFVILTVRSEPDLEAIFFGFLPNKTLLNPEALYYAAGILGAICMPHSLLLASHLVKLRSNRDAMKQHAGDLRFVEDGDEEEVDTETEIPTADRQDASIAGPLPSSFKSLIPFVIRMSNLDSVVALTLALAINCCILIVGSAAFYPNEINELPEAYRLFLQHFGQFIAGVFGVSLLISGIGSSMTGTLAGQVVMEGFLGPSFFKLQPWQRRLLTRSVAIVPAMTTVLLKGEDGVSSLLVLTQVILAICLPFTVLPLVIFTSSKKIMSVQVQSGSGGQTPNQARPLDEETPLLNVEMVSFANTGVTAVFAWFCTLIILVCNALLLYQSLHG